MNARHLIAALVLTFVPTTAALAEIVTYTVDPARSVLTLSGTWGSFPITPQTYDVPPSPNSLTTSYTGIITANRDTATNTFQLTGGSVTAQNARPYAPFAFLANYGLATSSIMFIDSTIRNFAFSLLSPVITSPASFDTAPLSASIVSGKIDYTSYDHAVLPGGSYTGVQVSDEIEGGLALTSQLASLTKVEGTDTLTIPIDGMFTIPIDSSPFGDNQILTLHLVGTLVATNPVPEPASFAILATCIVLCRRRRAL